ncbi:NAD(P)-dependent oxidoreductase [Rheinheimera soli]|uniref:NADH-flavin reductase n=1 Tax=Rheinheimera soli TaxID=443616 RepID=A0ABU1VU74_9GAMM|nr:NAD(P)-dependent oxidoreductase [Rheinheimera soli]MDR7119130.1 putative NADH-flavin reductase [Rheinheimera soli]
MNIAIIGASGFIGSALTAEALSRGHQVTALVSRPERIEAADGLTTNKVDVLDTQALTLALAEAELVISAFSGHKEADVASYYLQGFQSILAASIKAQVPRLLVVGGAASLEYAPGQILLNSPDFPAAYLGTAQGAYQALQLLKAQNQQHWSYLSPAADIFPGGKTGRFRLGQDQLLTDTEGKSRISVADYAVAMLDEAEQNLHSNQRFCVAY